MKNNNITILSTLALIFLLTIGIIMAIKFPRGKVANNNENRQGASTEVLGEFTGPTGEFSPTPFNINQFVQNSLQNTKETVLHTATEKVTELEKTIINTINNEVANLSKSQIEALKLQICKDLGVITITPNPTQQP